MTGDLRETVRKRYADAATDASCCGPEGLCSSANGPTGDDFGSQLYRSEDLLAVPQGAADVSLLTSVAEGCPNAALESQALLLLLLPAVLCGAPETFDDGRDVQTLWRYSFCQVAFQVHLRIWSNFTESCRAAGSVPQNHRRSPG